MTLLTLFSVPDDPFWSSFSPGILVVQSVEVPHQGHKTCQPPGGLAPESVLNSETCLDLSPTTSEAGEKTVRTSTQGVTESLGTVAETFVSLGGPGVSQGSVDARADISKNFEMSACSLGSIEKARQTAVH